MKKCFLADKNTASDREEDAEQKSTWGAGNIISPGIEAVEEKTFLAYLTETVDTPENFWIVKSCDHQ